MLFDKYLPKSKMHGRTPIFSYYDTLEIIADCKKANIQILGLDGFYINDKSTIPLQEYSIDFTSKAFNYEKTSIWEKAKKFVSENPKDIFYEIVL